MWEGGAGPAKGTKKEGMRNRRGWCATDSRVMEVLKNEGGFGVKCCRKGK